MASPAPNPTRTPPAGTSASPSDSPSADSAISLDQQVTDLLAQVEAAQHKVEQAMQDPPTEAQVDLAALESAITQASQPAPAAAEPDLELTDDLVTSTKDPEGPNAADAPEASLRADTAPTDADIPDAELDEIMADLAADSVESEPAPAAHQQPVPTDQLAVADEPGEAPPHDRLAGDATDQLDDLLDDPADIQADIQPDDEPQAQSGGTLGGRDDAQVDAELGDQLEQLTTDDPAEPDAATVEQLADDLDDLIEGFSANVQASPVDEQAADFFQAAPPAEESPAASDGPDTGEAIPESPPIAATRTPAVAVPPAGADDVLADLDRAIADTATELIKAEAPAVAAVIAPPPPPVAPPASSPAPAAPAPAATPPPHKAAGSWLWTRLEPKLHQGVLLLNKPLDKKPASTRRALGLVGIYTLVIGAACWGWAMFLRPDTAASAAVEPFDFQKSGLAAPEHHEEHGSDAHETEAASHGASGGDSGGGHGDAKGDGKGDKKKPLLDSGDGKSVINKTMDERAKKAKDAAKGGKAEAKKSGGH